MSCWRKQGNWKCLKIKQRTPWILLLRISRANPRCWGRSYFLGKASCVGAKTTVSSYRLLHVSSTQIRGTYLFSLYPETPTLGCQHFWFGNVYCLKLIPRQSLIHILAIFWVLCAKHSTLGTGELLSPSSMLVLCLSTKLTIPHCI